MTKKAMTNLAASVRERLANLARAQKEDFQELLSRYARERLLYRLSISQHRDDFILKGALLFSYWTGAPHRPTRDLDLLGHGAPDIGLMENVIRDLCEIEAEPDGLIFQPGSVHGERIKDEEELRPPCPPHPLTAALRHWSLPIAPGRRAVPKRNYNC